MDYRAVNPPRPVAGGGHTGGSRTFLPSVSGIAAGDRENGRAENPERFFRILPGDSIGYERNDTIGRTQKNTNEKFSKNRAKKIPGTGPAGKENVPGPDFFITGRNVSVLPHAPDVNDRKE